MNSQTTTTEAEQIVSYWSLIRRRFLRNRAAVAGMVVMSLFYLVMLPAEFTAPYGLQERHRDFVAAPPQRVRFVDMERRLSIRPFVYGLSKQRDPKSFRRTYTIDTNVKFNIRLFDYDSEGNMHLFGARDGYVFLLGTDLQGRDMLSRIIYGGRVSLTVGLLGVTISLTIGTMIGLVSGYFGGRVDNIIQRSIEILMSFPSIPLWLALSAALPAEWNPIKVFFSVTIILSIIGWGGLARVVRGMTLAMKTEEYVEAARMNGGTTWWILSRHLLPGNVSYIIVQATLAVPSMILGETALSFLGLGIRPPMTSWGVLLKQAQDTTVIAHQPWLILPVVLVVISVLCLNFVGDGMRDAADPFSRH